MKIKNTFITLIFGISTSLFCDLSATTVHIIDYEYETQVNQLNDNGIIVGSKITKTYSDPYLHQVYTDKGRPWYTEIRYATVTRTPTPTYWSFGTNHKPLSATYPGTIFMNNADIILIDQAVGDVVTQTTYPDGSKEETRNPTKQIHVVFADGNKITFEPASLSYIVEGFDDEGNIFFKNEKKDQDRYVQNIYSLDEIKFSDVSDAELNLMNKRFFPKKTMSYKKEELTSILNQYLVESLDIDSLTEQQMDNLNYAIESNWAGIGWSVDEVLMVNNRGQVVVKAFFHGIYVPLPNDVTSGLSYFLLIDTTN